MKIRPKDVGLPFKEVPFISVGECTLDSLVLQNPAENPPLDKFIQGPAHVHQCPNFEYRDCICVQSETFFKSRIIMWHEYAHILTPKPYIVVECDFKFHLDDLLTFTSEKALKDWNKGHSSKWAEIMRSFNLEPRSHLAWGDLSDTW